MIIISFTRSEEKWRVLKQTKKLQGLPGVSIDQDYIEKTRVARSKLFKLRKLIRNHDNDDRWRVIDDKLQWRDANFSCIVLYCIDVGGRRSTWRGFLTFHLKDVIKPHIQ